MKYLYPYECEKKNLSTPAELQAAIDGNRREGRRSSYGQYEAMHNQMQMVSIPNSSFNPMSFEIINTLFRRLQWHDQVYLAECNRCLPWPW